MSHSPAILIILDGWGLGEPTEGNAIALAQTPCFDRLLSECSTATLTTYGPDVGLPEGQMGNSEVGHMNIGAGRIVEMDLARIDRVMRDGSFAHMAAFQDFVSATQAGSGTCHIMGVLSDGGVHGHIDHMISAAQALHKAGLSLRLHLFTDGRDVAPVSAARFLHELQTALPKQAQIATLSGRYYALDRDNRWDRVAKAYSAIAKGDGPLFNTARAVLENATVAGETDEFVTPAVISKYGGMHDGDSVLMLNFRADRARELLSALGAPGFDAFETGPRPTLSRMAGFTSYSEEHDTFMSCIFTKPELKNTLGEWLAKQGKTQFRIAETEKYPHVTFFLNGGQEQPFKNEDRYLAPSPKVATYDLQPEMSAAEVTDNLTTAIEHGYDLIVANYANPDMVGHTGDLQAATAAVEAVDQALSKVLAAASSAGTPVLICADHGNCETMIDPETGGPHTAHTTNPVPVILYNATGQMKDGKLGDIAPTLLDLMGLQSPPEMSGTCLREG
ncbi:MAG: 2,3-bisphosphoglycerate-independent phosphoglycerate mutase [Pseudomonadota bacterium]